MPITLKSNVFTMLFCEEEETATTAAHTSEFFRVLRSRARAELSAPAQKRLRPSGAELGGRSAGHVGFVTSSPGAEGHWTSGGLPALWVGCALVRRAEVHAGLALTPVAVLCAAAQPWEFCFCGSGEQCESGRQSPTERLPRGGKPEQSGHFG